MRVLIIDDHPLFRAGLQALLQGLEPGLQALSAGSVSEAAALCAGGEPLDLVLLDMNLPGASRLEGLATVRALFASASVVVISGEADVRLMLQAVDAGASGYIPKTTDADLTIQALRLVLAQGVYLPPEAMRRAHYPAEDGLPRLSDKQSAVLKRLLQGKANKVIARELDIAEGTVKAHLWAIYQALGVNSRSQAMCRAHEMGLFGGPA